MYESSVFVVPGSFTSGIEGPACDGEGNLYAANYQHQHTIGRVTPKGECSVFLTLPGDSIGNGIRFDTHGNMLIADYVGHNIFRLDMKSKTLKVLAHEPRMNQPNDIAITSDDVLFASDPLWKELTGNLWRIDPNGKVTLLESDMGTTNGIEVSPDDKTLYVNESRQKRIWKYDIVNGRELRGKELFYQFEDFEMDGMRCDAVGRLYVTRYGMGAVAVLSQDGRILRQIAVSGKKCSNLTFGGHDGRTVFVTLADTGGVDFFRVNNPGRDFVMRAGTSEA